MSAQQLDIFQLIQTRQARDEGILRAVKKANNDSPGWSEAAYHKIIEFLQQHEGEFMCEQIRSFAAMDDEFELPKKGQAWAGPIGQAKKNKIIKFVRWGASKGKTGHGHPCAVWIKV